MLTDDKSTQMFHTELFLLHSVHEKLIYFILDANGEHFLLDQPSCAAFVNIFGHFASIFGPNARPSGLSFVDKQLFFKLGEFLNILHSDNNVYIVNLKNEFYFNLGLSKTRNDDFDHRPPLKFSLPKICSPRIRTPWRSVDQPFCRGH